MVTFLFITAPVYKQETGEAVRNYFQLCQLITWLQVVALVTLSAFFPMLHSFAAL